MTSKKDYEGESHIRSIIKGVTWRIIASTTILIITYLTTGNVDTAITIAGIEFFVKLLLYYIHERVWNILPRGTFRGLFKNKQ